MPRKNNYGFLRVGAAVPKIKVSDCRFNVESSIESLRDANRKGVDVLAFPELSLTGYTCEDLFQQEVLQEAVYAAVDRIRRYSRSDFAGIFFIGAPLHVDGQLFNCAIAICNGKILGVVPKSYLPNYKEFYEARWFSPASAATVKEITLNGATVPFGTDLLFAAANRDDLIVGVEICEDLWVPVPPSCFQSLAGATVLLNLSASNETIGKAAYRRQLVANQSARCLAAYVYASSGPSESSKDLVFGGHCLIGENGNILSESERFESESTLTISDVDLDHIKVDRMRSTSFSHSKQTLGTEFRRVYFKLPEKAAPGKLARTVEAHPFVPRGEENLRERCEEIFSIQLSGLRKRASHLELKNMVIGVSGGLDSTLALLVACKTVDALGLPRSTINGITMPGFGTTSRTKSNALALMQELGVSVSEIDIKSMCFEEMKALNHKPFGMEIASLKLDEFIEKLKDLPSGSQDLVFENVQARCRTNILMNKGFVIGTGDVSELALGWCTYNADHMSMYNPNCSIPKTLVKFLVKWAAKNQFDGKARRILLDVCATEVSPELLPVGRDGKSTQKTESSVGPYELNDFFLYQLLRFGSSPEKIAYLAERASFHGDYKKEEIRHWLKLFYKRFFNSQFKRSCLPDGPKVGSVSFSPRGDWRMPTDASAALWLAWAEAQ